ncbi:membrane or secreted protein [mine drainage metagenome]|uniref:Membrane or secreted protein n=1 Tax=mine drainage metagenome TaxID=410659 RepID=T1B416_9ZZZZ
MGAYYLRLALRALRNSPVLTALMVLALAVGIGASMTMLTVLHVLSGDPLPGRSAHLYYPQSIRGPLARNDGGEPRRPACSPTSTPRICCIRARPRARR